MPEAYVTGPGGARYRTRADYVVGRVAASRSRARQRQRIEVKTFIWTGWHPRCRCYATPVLASQGEFIDWLNNGGSADFSGQITDTPPQFKKWVADHRDDIAKSIYRDKVPYFIRDTAGTHMDLSAHKLSALQMRVVDNRARYLAYDTSKWRKELFDKQTGGYVTTDLRRIEHSRVSKNEQAKFVKELSMASVFAKNGYRVELLNEVPRVPSPDAKINGKLVDFKRMSSHNNIVKEAVSATEKQGANMVGFQFDTMNEKNTFRD